MRKLWIARLTLCISIAALSACGDSEDASGPSASAGSGSAATTVTAPNTPSAATSASSTSATTTGSQPSTASQPGTTSLPSKVKLSASAYSVAATAGTAVISVERVGSSGSTAIEYATSNGSGTEGVDYTATSGKLTWTNGDTSIRKILVVLGAKAVSGRTFHVALSASSAAIVATPSNATVTITAPAEVLPPAAEQAGYTMRTLGPAMVMGENWFNDDFYGMSGTGGTNNSDGTVLVSGAGSGHIATATPDAAKPNHWKGMAFGGGAYFEAVFSIANANTELLARWPAFWGSDIENMAASAVTDLTQWLGQPEGFGNWIETDFFEYDRMSTTQYGVQIHNWYGYHPHNEVKDVTGYTAAMRVPSGFKWSDPHKYGFLWVPATATSHGYVQAYLDDVPMGPPVYWAPYNAKAPPAPALGTTAFSVLDARHLALIFDTSRTNPMTIHTVSVWQRSAASNLVQ